jgi:hypothetical protein
MLARIQGDLKSEALSTSNISILGLPLVKCGSEQPVITIETPK